MGHMVEPTPRLLEYLAQIGGRETRNRCAAAWKPQRRSDAVMQIAPEQGAFLGLLVRMTGATALYRSRQFHRL